MTDETDDSSRDRFSEAVEELLDLDDLFFPDPVDVFEDNLARELGLVRYPQTPLTEWRRMRVAFIEGETDL